MDEKLHLISIIVETFFFPFIIWIGKKTIKSLIDSFDERTEKIATRYTEALKNTVDGQLYKVNENLTQHHDDFKDHAKQDDLNFGQIGKRLGRIEDILMRKPTR